MSRRRSLGDLVPKDISEVVTREARAQRGHKKSGGSLGHAFSWLKGSRRKKGLSNGLNRTASGTAGGASPNPGRQNRDPAKAGPKASDEQKQLTVHFSASQHYQENVFIQGSRPQYLEDLHTEAQEGLKIQQREEHGVDCRGDQSANSISGPPQERDTSAKDGACYSNLGSTTWNSASTATSAVSAVSTRPVLTRQGSTFKPLNPVKRFEKNKKRSRRTTILGIPQHVQKELALHKSSTFGDSRLPNGGGQACNRESDMVVVPTVEGETVWSHQEGARVHLTDLEQASREERLLQHHLQVVYQDDQTFGLQHLGSHRLTLSSDQRPKSLAVPWMTSSVSSTGVSFLQEPAGPVMSISPQATYLSKIIPNAVLPASVDVIQIDRGNSRNRGSVHNYVGNSRAVSKSSLEHSELSASPASSRRSNSDCSHDSFPSAATPPAAPASNWSQSQSSETIMSQTSTLSFKPSAGSGSQQTVSLAGQESQRGEPSGDLVSLQSSTSCSSTKDSSPGSSNHVSDSGQSVAVGIGEQEGMRTSCSSSRSLSIVKTKLPPAPPRRINSLLHGEVAKGQCKQLVKIHDLNDTQKEGTVLGDAQPPPVHVYDAPVSSTQGFLSPTLSPAPGEHPKSHPESSCPSPHEVPPSEGSKFERTMSPSSGYSSQSGTPTLSPKGIPLTTPGSDKKKRPVKPERSGSRASSSAASASSSLTSLSSATSDPVHPETLNNSQPQPSSPPPVAPATEEEASLKQTPSPAMIREWLDIPPHPKVKAPSPPPSETWAHKRQTIELLCGLAPNTDRVVQLQKQQQLRDVNIVQHPEAENEESKLLKPVKADEQLTTKVKVSLSIHGRGPFENSEQISEIERVRQELKSPESRSTERASLFVAEAEKASKKLQGQGTSISSLGEEINSLVTLPKKEPPPVMRKSIPKHREKVVLESELQVNLDTLVVKEESPVEIFGLLKKPRVDLTADHHKVENGRTVENTFETNPVETPPLQSLAVGSPTVPKTSPPPSPPPSYHPPPPPIKKTPSSGSSAPTDKVNIPQVDSCWPPPPPPLQALIDSAFEGPEEFPPPPPPLLTASLPDVMGCGISEIDVPYLSVTALEELDASWKDAIMDEIAVNMESLEQPSLQIQTVIVGVSSMGSNSHLDTSDTEYSQIKDDPPLQQDVPPPPLEAPPPLTVTNEMPSSHSFLTPPSSVSLPPFKQLEESAPSESLPSASQAFPINVPSTKNPTESNPTTVSFRRQPSLAGRDTRAKELLARQKSAPIPKEDANIPLVTPSLLQMVRLRSVNVGDELEKDQPEESQSLNGGSSAQDPLPTVPTSFQNVPQKPLRKSLSLKSRPPATRSSPMTLNAPSTRLQEAIRLKTAAMSSRDGLSSRLSLRPSPANSNSTCNPVVSSPKPPDEEDAHKSPASTASFIFSRSTKKVVIETPINSPETQASLKQSLAAELMQESNPSRVSNGTAEKADVHSSMDPAKFPPLVAKKPGLGSSSTVEKMADANGENDSTPPTGQIAPPLKELQTTTKTVTPGTIETLF